MGFSVVSLNRKRRIFRSGLGAVAPASLRSLMPSAGLLLAAAGGLAMAGAVAWMFVRSSDAPALAPSTQRLSAPANSLAVIDGSTLRVGADVVRLAGIVAPARDTLCRTAAGADQDCGVAAANALAALVRRGPLECAIHGRDANGRPVGDCQSGGVSLSEAQVRDGWARAQAAALKPVEEAARTAGRGLWRNAGAS
ncbi:MAG: thermonuclease family protein [Proteobacteria bacterium]|nr:thermonuclease family protein [Pseudomonadota bacterium]